MQSRALRSLAIVLALAACGAFAATATKPAADPATLKALLQGWKGKPVTLNWYDKDDKKTRRTLLGVGDDFIKLDSDDNDAVYIPLSRVARVEVKGDKLVLVLNTGG